MTSPDTFRDDIFVIPNRDGKYYLYAPVRRRVAVINASAAAAVAKYLAHEETDLSSSEFSVVKALQKRGILGSPVPATPTFPKGYIFRPHEVTLFPTSRCNLRCRYCYAEAGQKDVTMSWGAARAAIDLVANNAGYLGSEKMAVGFHGGGEPTVAWPLIVQCVEYAYKKADEKGLDLEIFAATNGLLNERQREYIIKHFTTVNVSLDGPKDIQDYQRPKINGGGSYRQVSETLRFFDNAGFHYGLRSTITRESVYRMEEIVDHLCNEFKIDSIHMEPVWSCGRCITSGEETPSEEDFIYHFQKAVNKGRKHKVNIFYSGARVDVLTSKFCAAAGDGFNILPEGVASSCYEVTELSDPRADIFHYGKYDAKKDGFVFNWQRLESLQNLSVENISYCQDCFCKWHCAGDCLAKVFERSGSASHHGSDRCKLNRELTLAQLDNIVQDS